MKKTNWDPNRTFVVILALGTDQWADPDDPHWERHITLRDFFVKSGVPPKHVMYCDDKNGHPDEMRKNFPEFLKKTDEDSIFFFYYTGHGGLDEEEEDIYFCHPDTEDAVYAGELFDMIEENFNGEQAVLMADCCYSGMLAEWLDYRDTDIVYGVLTSATSDIQSTGNWTYTDCLLSGLRGESDADRNNDGTITFRELSKYVLKTMEEVEEQPAEFAFSEGFDPTFKLAIVTDLRKGKKKGNKKK